MTSRERLIATLAGAGVPVDTVSESPPFAVTYQPWATTSQKALGDSIVAAFDPDALPLPEAKAVKISAIEAKSADLLAAGVTHRGVTFSLAPSSWTEWQNLFLGVSGGLLPLPYPVYGVDYSSVVLADAGEFQAFIAALTARRAYVVGGGTALAQQVQQATTLAALDAITDQRV